MRISQDTARLISNKLTEKSRVAADALRKEFRELVTSIYENETPKEVRDLRVKHPDWFHITTTITLRGHGFNHENVSTTRSVVTNGGNNANMPMNEKTGTRIWKSYQKWDKADKDFQKLREETARSLVNMGTTKRVAENLPVAIPYLPAESGRMALVLDLGDLNKRLARQPELKTAEVK